jgi:hypothetical protein
MSLVDYNIRHKIFQQVKCDFEFLQLKIPQVISWNIPKSVCDFKRDSEASLQLFVRGTLQANGICFPVMSKGIGVCK